MAISAIITRKYTSGSDVISQDTTYTGSGRVDIVDETVPNGSDNAVSWAVDVSQVKAIYIHSTRTVTIETNSSSAADDTLAVTANVPYIWTNDMVDSFAFGTDVTSLFVTNASGQSATFNIRCILDVTP